MSYFTGGAALTILAGALGGLAGAAIEKSNLKKGAIEGAIIGASVAASAASNATAAEGGGTAGSGGSTITSESSSSVVLQETTYAASENKFAEAITQYSEVGLKITDAIFKNRTVNPRESIRGLNLDNLMNRITDRLASGAPGMPFNNLPSVGGGGPGTAGSVVLANIQIMQVGLAVNLAGINSGGILLQNAGNSGNKNSWFDKLFGRKGFFNTWFARSFLRIGMGWKQPPGGGAGYEVFRIASGGKDAPYHLHIDFEQNGVKFDFKWK